MRVSRTPGRCRDIDLEWHDQLAVTNPALYDVIRAARGAGGDSTMSYLLMMSVRLLELRRVLKETGSPSISTATRPRATPSS